MHPELTNLLPHDRSKKMQREYYVRLGTVIVSALSAVVLGSGALLIPSYLYLQSQITAEQAHNADLDARLATSNGKEASARLSLLTQDANYLARLATTSAATASIRSVLMLPRPGIVLSGFTYAPASKGPNGKMTIAGTAATREMLRAYVQTLGTVPFVTTVDLPISSYAKERDIPFIITLTGTLSP